jgi:hypothetical protein
MEKCIIAFYFFAFLGTGGGILPLLSISVDVYIKKGKYLPELPNNGQFIQQSRNHFLPLSEKLLILVSVSNLTLHNKYNIT